MSLKELPDNFKLIFRTRIRIHYTWFGVFLFTGAGVATQFSTDFPLLERTLLGLVAGILFLLIALLREYLVTLMAVRRGHKVRSTIIYALMAVRDIEWNQHTPALETLLAVTGMLVNIFIAGILFVLFIITSSDIVTVTNVLLEWLAYVTLMVAIVDILPGLPMNGGRLLGAVLWKVTDKYHRITVAFSWIGWFIGAGFIITGVIIMINTWQWFGGVMLILAGLIIQNGATNCRRLAVREAIIAAESS